MVLDERRTDTHPDDDQGLAVVVERVTDGDPPRGDLAAGPSTPSNGVLSAVDAVVSEDPEGPEPADQLKSAADTAFRLSTGVAGGTGCEPGGCAAARIAVVTPTGGEAQPHGVKARTRGNTRWPRAGRRREVLAVASTTRTPPPRCRARARLGAADLAGATAVSSDGASSVPRPGRSVGRTPHAHAPAGR